MQALIDFDGWRKWKDFASSDSTETTSKLSSSYSSTVPKSKATPNLPTAAANGGTLPPAATSKEEKAAKRRSLGVGPTVVEEKEDTPTTTPELESN
jgi:osomolarity two-component system response regulator SSK1